jgi:hypothetical protein
MAHPERENSPAGEDPRQAAEAAWLQENLSIFWPAAHAGFSEMGRGAIVIDGYSQPLGEETQFHYASLAEFEEQEDVVSGRMAELVSEYNPEQQFVAVIIRQPEVEYEYSMYQIGVGERLVEAVNAYDDPEYRPKPPETEPEAEPQLEPPDLETLMAWVEEGGCEAACPDSCWIEPDGVCSHGHPSWLLKLGLI